MTWTAPQVSRTDPPNTADEREALDGWLDFHRSTLLMKCQGLAPEQLARRAVPPSALSLLGLVRHMAEVEQAWFRMRFAGEAGLDYLYCSDEYPDGDFDLAEAGGAEADRERDDVEVDERLAAELGTPDLQIGTDLDADGEQAEIDRAADRHPGVGLVVERRPGEGGRAGRHRHTEPGGSTLARRPADGGCESRGVRRLAGHSRPTHSPVRM